MKLPFVKMEGAGNDYVHVDGFGCTFPLQDASALARAISDRHRGVGGDGLILLARSQEADCKMVMWNADGSRGAMCGNGLRCVAKLAYDHGRVPRLEMTIQTDVGVRRAFLERAADGSVTGARVEIGEVRVQAEPELVELAGESWHLYRGDAGNPHAILFLQGDLEHAPVETVGAALQERPGFEGGVNVEFVSLVGDGSLSQRTFERGSGETLACGSGAAAVAQAAVLTGRVKGWPVTVHLRGGTLVVHREEDSLLLEGLATTVFEGEFEWDPGDG